MRGLPSFRKGRTSWRDALIRASPKGISVNLRVRQAAEERYPAGILCEALECGSLLPLWQQPASWLGIGLSVKFPRASSRGGKRQQAAALQSFASTKHDGFLASRNGFTNSLSSRHSKPWVRYPG